MDDLFMMMVFVLAALAIVAMMRRRTSAASQTATAAKPQATQKEQMVEDIKATKTSQVSDAVAILDDLGSTSQNYRHYCELVGSSMASGGVTAPYSRRQVAYYDIKCYRLDATYGGGQTETLVAHEHSIDPFFFTDASCDTPIYVDLESFGDNVILVNSTNHVEGPNSDFAQAFKKSATSATAQAGSSSAFAAVAHVAEAGSNVVSTLADALRNLGSFLHTPALQPALALAGGGSLPASSARPTQCNVMFASADGRGTTHGRGGNGHGGSHAPQDRGMTVQVGPGTVHVGYGPTRPPHHLDDFMGGYGGGPWVMGGGYGHVRPTTNSADVLLGMSLGALLNSMSQAQQTVTTTGSTPTDTFRGYRLVENVVPLGSPVYCIGEIYRSGSNVYMSRSLAKDYPTSYFATKPESEVLSALGA